MTLHQLLTIFVFWVSIFWLLFQLLLCVVKKIVIIKRVGWRALAFYFNLLFDDFVLHLDELGRWVFFYDPLINLKFAWHWSKRWRTFLVHLGLWLGLFWGFHSAFLLLGQLLQWPPPTISLISQLSGNCSFPNSVISYSFNFFFLVIFLHLLGRFHCNVSSV